MVHLLCQLPQGKSRWALKKDDYLLFFSQDIVIFGFVENKSFIPEKINCFSNFSQSWVCPSARYAPSEIFIKISNYFLSIVVFWVPLYAKKLEWTTAKHEEKSLKSTGLKVVTAVSSLQGME